MVYIVPTTSGGCCTMAFWLMKCEPNAYSIDDLKRDKITSWEGVRNYQARNFLRDELKEGDMAIYYHSNSKPSGAAGVMKVVKSGYPDPFAFQKGHKYYDSKSTIQKPTWYTVDVEYVKKFDKLVSLAQIKQQPELEGIMVAKKGIRLSVQPLSAKHFNAICQLGDLLNKNP